MMTICSKIGTSGFCVAIAVDVGEGVGVNVAATGTDVRVGGTEGIGIDVSVGLLEQATEKIKTTIQTVK